MSEQDDGEDRVIYGCLLVAVILVLVGAWTAGQMLISAVSYAARILNGAS